MPRSHYTDLADSAVILPSEPIGKGATWKVSRPVDDAVAPEMTVTYTLTAIDGDSLTVKVDGEAPATTDTLHLGPGWTWGYGLLLNTADVPGRRRHRLPP